MVTMNLTQTKAVVLVMLGMIKLISGLAPLLLTKILKKKNKRILRKFIGVVLCFGGGVLLSTVFIHMVSEVRESMEKATSMGMLPEDVEFPFGELLICVGFLLILLIESVVHKMFGNDHHHDDSSSYETNYNKNDSLSVSVDKVDINIPRLGLDNLNYDNSDKSKKIVQPQFTTTEHPDVTVSRNNSIVGDGKISSNVCYVSNPSLKSYISYSSDSESISTDPSSLPSSDKISYSKKSSENNVLSSLRGLLVVLALSVHSLFEGMAIGLEETESGVWKLFLAISIHSTAIVFCIGTEMISTGTKKSKIMIYMVVLSLVTPAGVLLGILLTVHMEQANGGHILLVGVLQGLAGGTLLYITFFEVLAQEKLRKYGMSGLLGGLMIMIGFTMMTLMEASAGGHSHGGGQSGHGGHGHGGSQLGHGGHGHSHGESSLGHGGNEHSLDGGPFGHDGYDYSHGGSQSGHSKHADEYLEHDRSRGSEDSDNFGHKHSNNNDFLINNGDEQSYHSKHAGNILGNGSYPLKISRYENNDRSDQSGQVKSNGSDHSGHYHVIGSDYLEQSGHANSNDNQSYYNHSNHDQSNPDHINHNQNYHNHSSQDHRNHPHSNHDQSNHDHSHHDISNHDHSNYDHTHE